MGCSHSTPIPSDREIALSKPTKTSTFLLEHHQKLGFSVMDGVPMEKTSEGNPFIDVLLTGGSVDFFEDKKAVTILNFRIGKHFPGYSGYLLDTQDNVVAYMLPLYRPGRPTIKIYTLSPAFNGQAPSPRTAKKEEEPTLYAWATFRMRGWHNTNVHYTLEYYEKDDNLRLAYDAHRAGGVWNPWTKLVVQDAGGTLAALMEHRDDFVWELGIAPTGVDPALMTCMAACVEMLAKAQDAAKRIQNNPNLVFKY